MNQPWGKLDGVGQGIRIITVGAFCELSPMYPVTISVENFQTVKLSTLWCFFFP